MTKEELIALAETKFKELDSVMAEIQMRFPPKKEYVYGFMGNGKFHAFYSPENLESDD